MFRWSAALLALTVGLLVSTVVLVQRERIVLDPDTGMIRLQEPPLYLQEPGSEVTGHRYLYDALLGWKNIPGMAATTHGRPLTINSRGLRDSEHSYHKPDGIRRILVLGDSYAWGYGVGDSEVFSAVLEKQFADARWEVINSGVSGWGTDQEYLFLTSEGLKYSPDIVVLAFFFFNDLTNNSSSRQYELYKPVFLGDALQPSNVPVPKPGSGRPVVYSTVSPLEITVRLISRIADVCREHQSRFIVMKFGSFLEPDNPDLQADGAAMRDYLIDHPNMDYLDLDAEFAARGLSVPGLIQGNHDGHWNALGHRITADILYHFLAESGVAQVE